MADTLMLKQVVDDLVFLKKKVVTIEGELREICEDLHQVKPSYLKKLERIKKGKFYHYASIKDMRKDIEE